MITNWRLYNFKSVRRELVLPLCPLTVLAGVNSSGKSTLIQSIVLVSQTLASNVPTASVVLNGPLAKLGQFDDLRSFGSEFGQILVGWECEPRETGQRVHMRLGLLESRSWRLRSVSCQVSFEADPRDETQQLHPRVFGCSVTCVAQSEDRVDSRSSLTVSRRTQPFTPPTGAAGLAHDPLSSGDNPRNSFEYQVEMDDQTLADLKELPTLQSAVPVGCLLERALPSRIILSGDVGYSLRPITGEIGDAMRYLRQYFASSVRYLGPLRDEPRPVYPLALTADPKDVGLRGEHTAEVLERYKDQHITYIPAAGFVADPGADRKKATRTLSTAVVDWLQYLGVADQVTTRDMGKLGHELKVTTSGTEVPHDLTHVGVGVSQVLPILVLCLLAEPDTTLVLEQPELHLHPAVQARLGDFFLSMALLGKQCILETHSEHLVNRFRVRVAEEQQTDLSSLLSIYFVEKRDGASEFNLVPVNEYGAILKWPKGFFDQGHLEAERILRAGLTKKRRQRAPGGPNA